MKKSTLFMIVSVVLALTLSLGGTLAYLTDTDYDTNVMVLGNIDIEQHETDRNGNEFKQGQMILPIVGDYSKKDTNGYPLPQNYIDKIVTVENVGNYDAYVRTFIAIPPYQFDGYDNDYAAESVLHWNGGAASSKSQAANQIPLGNGEYAQVDNDWYYGKTVSKDSDIWPANPPEWNSFLTEINGQKYDVYVITHKSPVAPGAETAPNLTGVYLDSKVDFDGVNYTYDGKVITGFDGVVEVLVATQAVQYDKGWTDAVAALNAAFDAPSATNHPWTTQKGLDTLPSTPSDDQALENDLTADKKNITIVMDKDMTYDVAAWEKDVMGSENTETITIIGNGHTLTFNQTNSDWNNIVTNGAKLVLNNVKLTNAGHNNGPWNRHDLNFACDVEMNDVISDKAFAFKAGAVLNNVTISDANTSDTYAIWIQPNGQTVSLDNCVIDMIACTDGRGIKIDEQYVDAPAKVTLNVANTVFKTEEKSAILVKSVAGADITLNNVDISAVAADSTNPVWVDEASAAYADLVTVTGGSKIVEP